MIKVSHLVHTKKGDINEKLFLYLSNKVHNLFKHYNRNDACLHC